MRHPDNPTGRTPLFAVECWQSLKERFEPFTAEGEVCPFYDRASADKFATSMESQGDNTCRVVSYYKLADFPA